MSLDQISKHLGKYKKITPPNDYIRTQVVLLLKKETDVIVKKKDITLRKGVLYIKTKPINRNEIFIKKKTLLEKINEKTEKRRIKDIR